jgi:hypothetical protein
MRAVGIFHAVAIYKWHSFVRFATYPDRGDSRETNFFNVDCSDFDRLVFCLFGILCSQMICSELDPYFYCRHQIGCYAVAQHFQRDAMRLSTFQITESIVTTTGEACLFVCGTFKSSR